MTIDNFEAVVFDLDGTLVDSEALAIDAGLRAAERLGLALGKDVLYSMVGLDNAACLPLLAQAVGAEAIPDLTKTWEAEYLALKETLLQLKPGVSEMIAALDQRNVPLAVATSSHCASALVSLKTVGLDGAFQTIVTRDCVTHAKPHPEPYLTAAERLSVVPENCLAFEDSTSGARSAKAAGMKVFVIPDLVPVDADLGHYRAQDMRVAASELGLGQ